MKYGINLKIDVSKIDKTLLFKGTKGVYLDATVFFDPVNPGQFDDHGMITQDIPKERKDAGEKGAILGNVKCFWKDGQQAAQQQGIQQATQAAAPSQDFDQDIPF